MKKDQKDIRQNMEYRRHRSTVEMTLPKFFLTKTERRIKRRETEQSLNKNVKV